MCSSVDEPRADADHHVENPSGFVVRFVRDHAVGHALGYVVSAQTTVQVWDMAAATLGDDDHCMDHRIPRTSIGAVIHTADGPSVARGSRHVVGRESRVRGRAQHE